MVQSADTGQRHKLRVITWFGFRRPDPWTVLVQSEMSAVNMVVIEVVLDQPQQMFFAERNDVIQQAGL